MDVRDMKSFEAGSFDAVIDKGILQYRYFKILKVAVLKICKI